METLHGYMIDENNWVPWPKGRVNSLVIDNSAYRIIRLNWSCILGDTDKQNRDYKADEWYLSHQEIMELIPEEKKIELGIPIDIFDEDDFFYIVYKEQEGIKLSMDDVNSLEKGEKMDVLLKVSSAIKILHDNGIVHGDLNPGCIEIYKGYDASIQVQILGFENYFFENSQFIFPCTYDLWLSPEMALYQRSVASGSGDWRKYLQYIFSMTDVFSLGLIFHQYCSDNGILPIYTKNYPWQEFITGGNQ